MTPEEQKANELIEQAEYILCDYAPLHDDFKEITIKLAIDKVETIVKLEAMVNEHDGEVTIFKSINPFWKKVLEVLKNELKEYNNKTSYQRA